MRRTRMKAHMMSEAEMGTRELGHDHLSATDWLQGRTDRLSLRGIRTILVGSSPFFVQFHPTR
jgi:hypothetical protein